MREDTFTNSPEDAAAYERLRGLDAWFDDRPSAAELADEALPIPEPPNPLVCFDEPPF